MIIDYLSDVLEDYRPDDSGELDDGPGDSGTDTGRSA